MSQRYSKRFKARMVSRLLAGPGMTATALSEEVGVPAWTLSRWRNAARAALGGRTAEPSKTALLRKRIQELEREISRKDKALAETAALLVLKKKLESLWADEDDGTTESSDD